jgi:hypothetical protein
MRAFIVGLQNGLDSLEHKFRRRCLALRVADIWWDEGAHAIAADVIATKWRAGARRCHPQTY